MKKPGQSFPQQEFCCAFPKTDFVSVRFSRRKWDTLFSYGESASDLKRALKSEEQGNPCDEGLRSVCWKVRIFFLTDIRSGLTDLIDGQAFLLCDGLDRSAWLARISDSRSAYSSLREHFLKYIEHPDDLQSAIDPLAEDEEVYRICHVTSPRVIAILTASLRTVTLANPSTR